MTGIGDLCDQGRCAQILRHIAENKVVEKVAERNAEVFVAVITGVLADLDVNAAEITVRQLVAVNIQRVTQIQETPI